VNHEHNRGHLSTYNEGIAMATGQYIGIVSADDYCLSRDAITRQVAVFERYPRVGVVYTAYAVVDDGHVIKHIAPQPADYIRHGLDEFSSLIWGNYVLHSGTLLRREVQAELGPYDLALPQSGDWDMWLRTAAKHDVGYIAEPMYAYRMHRQNMQNKGMPPWQQARQNVLTLGRGFAALPDDAPRTIWQARAAAFRHALLQTAWFDLFNGRRLRTWQGIGYALKCSPSLLLHDEFWRVVPRSLFMTVAGPVLYRRLEDWLSDLRGRGQEASQRI
jgi:hypothetical protein